MARYDNGASDNGASDTARAMTVDAAGNMYVTGYSANGSNNDYATLKYTQRTPPVLTLPAAVTLSADTGQCTATVVALGTPVTADNCTVASVTNDAPAVFPKGTTTITWTMKGAAGTTATDLQTVTINDAEKPTITAPSAVTATTNTACTATGVMLGTPVTADNCAVKSISNDAPTAFPLGATTVTDGSNNTATATQTVTVNDTEKPVLTVPAALVSSAPAAQYDVAIFFAPTDNCAGTTVVASLASGSTFLVGTTTVNVTATDASGNTRQSSFTVTVNDVTPPRWPPKT